MIDIQSELEGKLWGKILEAFGYDEDTKYFLLEIRMHGPLKWALKKLELAESSLKQMTEQGIEIWPQCLNEVVAARGVLEVLCNESEELA